MLRCYALDHEGFDIPDPEGLAIGASLGVQLRSTAGGRRMYSVQARLGFVSEGRARFVFESVPAPMIEALVLMATRCGVYRGTKPVRQPRATPVTPTPFGAIDSVEERLLVDIPIRALASAESVEQIRAGMFRVRHASPPAPGTMVAVRLPLGGRAPRVVGGTVVGVSGDEFWIETPDLAPELIAALDEQVKTSK